MNGCPLPAPCASLFPRKRKRTGFKESRIGGFMRVSGGPGGHHAIPQIPTHSEKTG